MTGIIAATIAAHVPTLGLAKNTPEYQRTLVSAERELGDAIRRQLKPDVWVIVSSHWVATFDWPITCQPRHVGHCVADEAPQLIPGRPYDYPGDPEFANALVEAFNAGGVPAQRNVSEHFEWDYGTFVPMQYLDPTGDVPVVVLPSVLMSTLEECVQAGELIHATAKKLGRRAVFVTSSALSHVLVRGRENWPLPERIEADQRFIAQLKAGQIDDALAGIKEYSKFVGAEMGGRPLATMLGAVKAMAAEQGAMQGRQYGEYAQSSGSGNVVMALGTAETLGQLAS
jgi:3,4-dihydroxyphenylacetate 2,3-dioxygenase